MNATHDYGRVGMSKKIYCTAASSEIADREQFAGGKKKKIN